MSELLSIIIPVYNTEHTLKRTVESVMNQTWEDVEIILVDDGSPDSAGALCDELQRLDERIKVIHKANEGLGLTRNAGLSIAKGDYVAFLDSDDWIEPYTYEKCINLLKNNNADACYYGRKVYKSDDSYSVVNKIPNKLVFKGEEIVKEFVPRYFGDWNLKAEEVYIRESACCALYNRHLIEDNDIEFCSERIYLSEDIFFNLDVCRYAQGIVIVPEDMYNQGFNPGSLTRKRDTTRFARTENLYRELLIYADKYPEIEDAVQRTKYRLIALIRGLIRDEVAFAPSYLEAQREVKKMISKSSVREIFDEFNVSVVDKKTRLFISWVNGRNAFMLTMFYRLKELKNGNSIN